jgi:hypothetical protein
MALVEGEVGCTPDDVWRVLSNGWLYGMWVVGSARIRAVDDGWPAVGTRIHHSVGAWPMLLSDESEVLSCEPRRRLELRTKGRPLGIADVSITLTPTQTGTHLSLEEHPVSGPGAWLLKAAGDWPVVLRNRECMRRLAVLCEGHAAGPASA